MINDFLNKSPVFKPSIGVNLNQQRLFPRSAGESEKRRRRTITTTDREKDLLERGGRRKKKKKRRKKTKRGGITLTGDCWFKPSLPAGAAIQLGKEMRYM